MLVSSRTVSVSGITPVMWGAYAGSAEDLKTFESMIGKQVEIAATFTGFWEPFPADFIASLEESGATPLIFLEPEGTLADVIAGKSDQTLRLFAEAAKEYGGPVILVPYNEPNLNEAPWGYGASPVNTAENFKAAWIHVHEIFRDAPNVAFGLAYNHVSIPNEPDNSFLSLYPGDAYVDYVGIDGFNWQEEGNWMSFTEVIGTSVDELKQFNKPIYIFSTGTGEDTGGDTSLKAAWIKEMFAWLASHPEVKGFLWFNENKESQGEKNWLVNSSPASLEAFKNGLQ